MKRVLRIALKIILGIIIFVVVLTAASYLVYRPTKQPQWGFNYSAASVQYLGLDPVATFDRALTELKPAKVRLMVYWEQIEPEQGKFDFQLLDTLLGIAEKHGTKVLFVVGHKQPRWPECHHPNWYETLPDDQKEAAIIRNIEAVVEHARTSKAIERWQVENEPFFDYGVNCKPITTDQLAREVAAVRKLDSRQIVITDSGEKGDWFRAAWGGDIFGTTMYRTVHDSRKNAYVTYPLPPAFYRVRAGLFKVLRMNKLVLGVELQAEPWFESSAQQTSHERQKQLMNPELFAEYVAYAKATGLPEHYFWGTEWWYWLADKHGDTSMLEAAKKVFQP